nr:VaFE repeat-containing surface-anchored protein [uncultured Schaedlerella sp.]
MRRFFYNMPGVLRTATAFLLIFSCMVSASAASVRAEERMESLAALEAEGTTAETMAGTAGGANEQIKQKVIEQAMAATGIPNQKSAGEGQAESAGTAEEGENSGSLSNPPKNLGGEEKNDPKPGDREETGQKGEEAQKEEAGRKEETEQKGETDQKEEADRKTETGQKTEAGQKGEADRKTEADQKEKIDQEQEADQEDGSEASASGRVPIGRKTIGDYGTAYVIGSSGRMLRSAVNSNCTITPGTVHSYGNWATTEFRVVTDKGHYMGYCAQPNKPTPSGTYQVSELDNPRIKMALMFGADGPWAGEASAMFGGIAQPYPYVHAMIGIEYTGETDGLTEQQILAMRNALNEQMNSGKAQLAIFKEYKAYVAYNKDQDIVWLEYEGPTDGAVILRKSSSAPHITDGNGCYSLSNARYGIYADASCTTLTDTLTIRESGASDPVELPEGDYWVQENMQPSGYYKDEKPYMVHVKAGETAYLDVSDVPKCDTAGLELVKRDQDAPDGAVQDCASLAGAQFTVRYYNGYYEKENLPQAPARTWVLETKAVPDGAGFVKYQALLREEYKVSGDEFYKLDGIPVLPLGTISIEETKAPDGYLLEGGYLQAEGSGEKVTGLYTSQIRYVGTKVALQGGNQYTVYNQTARGGVRIRKRDFDTKDQVPQGGASLENAVFAVINLNENTIFADGKAYGRNETITTIKTDENGVAQTPEGLLPYGKYRILETGAPEGYLETGLWRQEFFISRHGELVDLTDADHSIQNRVKRGDFALRKIDSNTQKVMPGVKFSLTSTTTGESHQITTDGNGYYSSSSDWNPHTKNTNQGGAEDGLWFGLDGEGRGAPVDNGLGALPYDTYILEEIPSEENEGKEMLQIPLVIYRDKVSVDLGNLENKDLEVEKPAISTTARNEATGNHYAQAGFVTVIDSVLYSGLKEQQEYLLRCTVMDRETQKPLEDPEGNPVRAEQAFTPPASAGITEVECSFDAAKLQGRDIVLYEELYYKGKQIAVHQDIDDQGQTIHFPEIKTKAEDKATGTDTSVAGKEITIVDTVSYKNLKPGQKYTLKGKLVDKDTGIIVRDAAGGEVTSEVKFTPKEKDGKAEVVFTFDGSNLEGKTLVAFETLEKDNKIYAVHADLESREQTIYFPKVRTSARDVGTNSRSARAEEDVEIVDTIFYSNLTAGREYTVEGTLMDRETGEPLLETGEKITAETTFTPEADSGTVDVTFGFNASDLAGKTVVAFESVTREGEEVAAHKDLHYEGQTLRFPKLETRAAEKESGSQKITADGEITIVDRVTYQNLIPGETYTIKGILMDKGTGSPLLIGEKEVTAEKTFAPEKETGTAEVEFTFQAGSLQNTETVVFEKLYIGGAELAAHEDIRDEGQTVRINMAETPGEETPKEPSPPLDQIKSVKTGDGADLLPYVLLMIASAAVLIAAARRKLG